MAELLGHRHPLAAIAALAALGAAAFCFVTTESLPVGLLEVISSSVHSSVPAVGLLVTAYAGVVAVTSAPLTHLTKHLPRRGLLCALIAIFVAATLVGAASHDYWLLLGSRIVTALAQALFWSVVAVTAVSLLPPHARSRAINVVVSGAATAGVIGVPAGTWLGQRWGWRLPFVVLGLLGMLILISVAILLPRYHPTETHAASGSRPDRRRYQLLIVTTVFLVAGWYTAYTYISRFLTQVAKLAPHDVASVLLFIGIGGAIGVAIAASLFDRGPQLVTVGSIAVLAVSLLGVYLFGTNEVAVVGLATLASFGLGAFVIANQNRVMIVAPGDTDIASAWAGAFYNVGIGGGSLVGSIVVSTVGVRSTVLVGGLFALAATVVVVGDHAGALQ